MRLKNLILLNIGCGLMSACLVSRYLHSDVRAVTLDMNSVIDSRVWSQPGSRMGFATACGCTITSVIVDDVLVLAVDRKRNTFTVQVTSEQAQSLWLNLNKMRMDGVARPAT